MTRASDAHRLGLVPVQAERSFVRGWLGLLAEDSAALVVDDAGIDQFVDPLPRLEGGV